MATVWPSPRLIEMGVDPEYIDVIACLPHLSNVVRGFCREDLKLAPESKSVRRTWDEIE